MKTVLDACCGSRMFWFNPKDERALFMDCRADTYALKDSSSKFGERFMTVSPDLIGDFRKMDFPDETFSLVVFDPPHLLKNGSTGWLAKKYGKLDDQWRENIAAGFKECFRVLKNGGTLIFKWNETDIPVSQILELTPEKPLFGNRCGKSSKSHWIVFFKSVTYPQPDGSCAVSACRDRPPQ